MRSRIKHGTGSMCELGITELHYQVSSTDQCNLTFYTTLLEAQYAMPEVPPNQRTFYRPTLLTTPLSPMQDLSGLPPRKRMHHMMPGFDVMSNTALQTQNLSLQESILFVRYETPCHSQNKTFMRSSVLSPYHLFLNYISRTIISKVYWYAQLQPIFFS